MDCKREALGDYSVNNVEPNIMHRIKFRVHLSKANAIASS